MRRRLHAGQLLLEGPVGVVAHEQIEAIAIHGHGEAVLGEDVAKERGVAVDILGGAKVKGEDLGGGIVDGAEEDEVRAPRLEPGERTAIDLDQGAAGGFGDAAAAGARGAARAQRGLAEVPPEPPHGLTRDDEAMLLAQLFGQVRVVEPDLESGHEPHDRGADGPGQTPRRRPAAITVDEGGGPTALEPAQKPPDVPRRNSKSGGHLRIRQPPIRQRLQQPRPMQFLAAQREGLH